MYPQRLFHPTKKKTKTPVDLFARSFSYATLQRISSSAAVMLAVVQVNSTRKGKDRCRCSKWATKKKGPPGCLGYFLGMKFTRPQLCRELFHKALQNQDPLSKKQPGISHMESKKNGVRFVTTTSYVLHGTCHWNHRDPKGHGERNTETGGNFSAEKNGDPNGFQRFGLFFFLPKNGFLLVFLGVSQVSPGKCQWFFCRLPKKTAGKSRTHAACWKRRDDLPSQNPSSQKKRNQQKRTNNEERRDVPSDMEDSKVSKPPKESRNRSLFFEKFWNEPFFFGQKPPNGCWTVFWNNYPLHELHEFRVFWIELWDNLPRKCRCLTTPLNKQAKRAIWKGNRE